VHRLLDALHDPHRAHAAALKALERVGVHAPTPPTGDIACAASPSATKPGRHQR